MQNIKLDDFKVGELYGFMVANDQYEVAEIKGTVLGYTSTQLGDAHSDLLMIKNIFSERPNYVDLDSIRSYYHIKDNTDYIDAEIYNPDLDEYNIAQGSTVKDIIFLLVDNWEYYDLDTRKDLVSKFSNAVTTDVLVDLITAYVSCRKHDFETTDKYLKALENQIQSIDKYNKFMKQIKPFMPKGYDKILDALIFDVCGFGR